ncbi:MAG: hypothetical protein OEY14_16710, partial [Myxococcales bacterium]|nr:hypothetical protein [Myxococcales bacterium]
MHPLERSTDPLAELADLPEGDPPLSPEPLAKGPQLLERLPERIGFGFEAIPLEPLPRRDRA